MTFARIRGFLLSGGVATVTHGGLMALLLHLGIQPHIAFFVGFTTAVIVRYFVDRNFVFEATGQSWIVQFPAYAIACFFAYLVSSSFFYLFLDVAGWHIAVAFVLSVLVSTVAAYLSISAALGGRRREGKA